MDNRPPFDFTLARKLAAKYWRNPSDYDDIVQNAWMLYAKGYPPNLAVQLAAKKWRELARYRAHTEYNERDDMRSESDIDFTIFGELAELAELLAAGASAADIAERDGVSRQTIYVRIRQLREIAEKLNWKIAR